MKFQFQMCDDRKNSEISRNVHFKCAATANFLTITFKCTTTAKTEKFNYKVATTVKTVKFRFQLCDDRKNSDSD